jgi:acetolactate synthase I/II/III large subunit
MNVAAYIAQFLVEKKVKHIFGFQGGAIIKLIHEMMATGKIEYIQNYHEQASSFCADAYSRVTCNLGVAIATSGPGATNLVTGITNAQLDSIPCLFITGQDYTYNFKKSSAVRQNGFQDVDIASIVKPVTKYSVMITDPARVRYELEKAFFLATSGRPGSVLVDIPIDIQFAEIEPDKLETYLPKAQESFEFQKVDDVVSMIKASKRPVILAGGGVLISRAKEQLQELRSIVNIPIVKTLNGLDACGDDYGFAGLYGNTHSNLIVYNADLLLILGSRLGLRQITKDPKTYTKATKIIHVDIDKNELGRKLSTQLSIFTDLKDFLGRLNLSLAEQNLPDFNTWHSKAKEWEQKYSADTHLNKKGVDPVILIKKINSFFATDTIFTADVGQNQMWVAQGIKIQGNQRILNSSGLGSMGYALPAAIGAKYASPNSQVVCFTGDGGFQMVVQELLLISQKKLDIKCFIFNNNTLGMMREVQERYYDSKYYGARPEDFVCVDLSLLAKTYNFEYLEIQDINQVDEIKKALKTNRPYLIDIKVYTDALCMNKYDQTEKFEKNIVND